MYSNERLGGGGQGIVWKGTWKGMEVAIKNAFDLTPMICRFSHSLVLIPTLSYFMVFCSIVTELVKGGSLYNFLHHKGKKNTPSDTQKSSWMKSVAEGMLFLHDKGLAHCHLKSGNVLLAGDNLMTAKLLVSLTTQLHRRL